MFTNSMGPASVSPSWRPPALAFICDQRKKELAMQLKTSSCLTWFMFAAIGPILGSCALKHDVQAAASGCDEFQTATAVATLEIDGKVKAFAQASADLRDIGDHIK